MSCSHLLILNRHVFLNTSITADEEKYSYEWILCGTDIKLGRYCNMESRHTVGGWRCNKPQSDLLALLVRKTLLSHHTHYQTVQSEEHVEKEFPGTVQRCVSAV